MTIEKTYIGKVVEDGDDLALLFPPEMLEELGWKEGDIIVWELDETNRIVLARKSKENDQQTDSL